MEKNQPEKKFRAGAISATVWQNQGQNKNGEKTTYRTISLERGYKDKKTDEWKSTNSFRASDLPKVTLLTQKAYEYVVFNKLENQEAGSVASDDLVEEEIVL